MEDLFNLDSVEFTQENLPKIDRIPTEDPYLCVPSANLAQFLQLASLFNWRNSRDLTSKSVSLTVTDDHTFVICRATDFDSYLQVKIPLIADINNPIKGTLVFSTNTLIKLVKLCPNYLTLAKKDGENPSVLIMGEWIEVEPNVIDESLYINSDPIELKGKIQVPQIQSIISIASSAIAPKDRSLQFNKDFIQSTYLWSTIQIPFSTPVSFLLSARESALLRVLSQNQQEISVYLTQSDLPRIVFQTENSTLWFIYRKPECDDPKLELPMFSLEVSPEQLDFITLLSETLPSSSGLLEFAYTDSLTITYKSKLQSTTYVIPTTQHLLPDQLEPSIIQTKLLRQVLKPLGNDTINLSWDNNTLFLSTTTANVSIQFECTE